MKKRYAIVRVDKLKHCPIYEGITGFCRNSGCDDCKMKENYGDTKELLVRKITTAQKRAIAKHKDVMTYEKMAEEIVEFLGIK